MNMPATKMDIETATPTGTAAPVVAMTPKRPPRGETYARMARETAVRVIPPLVVVALLMLRVWELVCRRAGSALPPPSKVFKDTKELILDPFFDHGGIDKGLFWHLSASLQRVALGYSLSAIAGIALGVLVGQSVWAMRGLDPLFQVLRTIPPLAWLPLSLAAFRDGQPSAIFVIFITSIWPIIINTAVGVRNIPQDYRNVAAVVQLNPLEFFAKIMIPAAAPYIFTGASHRHRLVLARDRGRGNADRRRRHRLLHLGRVEFLAYQRDHPGAVLCRHHRLRARPSDRGRRQDRHPRHRAELKGKHMTTYLKLDHIDKVFTRGAATTEVLKEINLTIEKGEYVSIIGHSGCGKSTLLNIIAGLTTATTGGVLLENREVNSPGPDRAVVFQNHSLLPWLTVYENVRLGVDKVFAKTKKRAERDAWVMHNLNLVQMAHAKDKRPSEISGGMKQRVGIARALAMEPKVLLLDEPFGALDALTRAHLQDSVMALHQKLGNTILMITHDVDEAVLLSDRIVMMTNGPSARIGEVLEVPLARPRKRLELATNAAYLKSRQRVLEFLYERHRFVEAA
ncbi:nitrate ABC transporter permease subunit [Bradyrhizobium sp. LM3.2]